MPFPAKLASEDILSAALAIVEQQGLGALSMRTLADALGVRASSLYRHFADRDALEAALADEAARRLHAEMIEAARGRAAHEAALAAGHAYVTFARDHAELYSLIHAPRPPATAGPGPAKDLWNFVLTLVAGLTTHDDDTGAAVALWAFLHGFAALDRSGLLGTSGPQGGFERGLTALLTGLSTPPAADHE